MRTVMNNIATHLGWIELERPHAWGNEADVWRQAGSADKPLLTTRDQIEFAAYAKAEMAKRGYRIRVSHEDVSIHFEHPSNGKWTHKAHRGLDRENPISEAQAVLLAINEALCL